MGFMALAAVASAGAVSAGVAASTIAMVSLGVTAVGIATKNKALVKIGGGLGLGSAAASMMGLGASEAAQVAANSSWAEGGAAEVAGGGGASALENGGQGLAQSAAAGPAMPATPPTTGLPESGSLDVLPDGSPNLPAPQVTEPIKSQGLIESARTVRPGLESAAPEQAGYSAQPAPAAQPTQSSGVAPTTDAGATKAAVSAGVKDTGVAMTKLQDGKSWFDSLGETWKGLDASGKLAVGQTAAGLVKGVGEGAFAYMGKDDERKYQDRLQAEKRARLSKVPSLTPFARSA
jgi:hypothetical protein